MLPLLNARHRAAGGTTLMLTATMLLLTATAMVAGLHFLLSARQIGTYQLDREIAFRAAETGLLDAEADLLQALRAGNAGADARLGTWPPAGQCGQGPRLGLCRPGVGLPPAWDDWLDARGADVATGVAMGAFTGTTLPVLPPDVAGANALPRYVVELLHERPAGEWLTPGYASGGPRLRFRITALGAGRDRAVRRLLQTEFEP
ncbi:hypothetical protein AB4Z48_07300 [Cupriavidus sp. 2TAF22]|uniref:pilus assembly PilX family protein n=1 Tax=unclassified Cupriavidus TaxID=2640874 RepID=UPI003F93C396